MANHCLNFASERFCPKDYVFDSGGPPNPYCAMIDAKPKPILLFADSVVFASEFGVAQKSLRSTVRTEGAIE